MSTNAPRSPKNNPEMSVKGYIGKRCPPPPPPPSKTILGSINFNHSCNCSGNCFEPKLLEISSEPYGERLVKIILKYDSKQISETIIRVV